MLSSVKHEKCFITSGPILLSFQEIIEKSEESVSQEMEVKGGQSV